MTAFRPGRRWNPRAFVLAASFIASLGSPSAFAATTGIEPPRSAWRGYVESFPSPAQIPLFVHLGIALDTPERLDSLVRVMDRAELNPQALAAKASLEDQAALVTQSIQQYGGRLAGIVWALPDSSGREIFGPEGREILDPLLRQLDDLSSVAGLLPVEARRRLSRGHRDIEMLIASQARSRAKIKARIEKIRNSWNAREDEREPVFLDAPPLANARFLDSTVEAIHDEGVWFDHISLRVGKHLYSFSGIRNTGREKFQPDKIWPGSAGFVFRADPRKIRAVRRELEELYLSAKHDNLPPFDLYSRKLEIFPIRNYLFGLSRNGGALLTKMIFAELVEDAGRPFLKTEDGFAYPVVKKRGKFYIQSLSCSTMTTYVMRKYFGIDVAFDHGANSLHDALSAGNPGRQAPDAIVDY